MIIRESFYRSKMYVCISLCKMVDVGITWYPCVVTNHVFEF